MTGVDQVAAILNDIEKAQVQQFVDNPTMVEAVKKVLLKGVYFEGTLLPGEGSNSVRNFALALASDAETLSNEQLGATLRAKAQAVGLIELGFNYLENYKTQVTKLGSKKNPAR